MSSNRKTAIIVGALFLIAMFASLFGGAGLIEPLLGSSDYLTELFPNKTQVLAGMYLELVNGLAVIGIGALMFPLLKKQSEGLALGYFGLRISEAVFYILGAIIPLVLIKLSQEYIAAGTSELPYFQTIGTMLIEGRAQIAGLLVPIFMGLGALIFYYLLYKSKLIPRSISVWGFIGAVLMLVANVLNLDLNIVMIMVFPLILNEIFLGFWLIVKGFDTPAEK